MIPSTLRRVGVLACCGLFCLSALAAPDGKPSTQPAAAGPASAPASQATGGKSHVVAAGDLTLTIEGEAVFEPSDPGEVRLRPKAYAGEWTIRSSIVPGTTVKKGNLLMRFDDEPITREISAAEIELATATANLNKLREDDKFARVAAEQAIESAKHELLSAQVALRWLKEIENPALIKQSELNLKEYKDRIDDQVDELDQLKKMYKTEDLTTATADIVIKRSVRQLDRSREQLKLFEPQLVKTKEVTAPMAEVHAKMAVEKAQLALEQVQATSAQGALARSLGIKAAELALDKATRKLADLKADSELFTQKSPADGIVYFGSMATGQWQNINPRALREGEKIAANAVLMSIVNPAWQRAVIAVPENKLALVQKDQQAIVKPKLLKNVEWTGRVISVSRSLGTRAGATGFDVQIQVQNIDPQIAPGMTASVKISAGRLSGVLLVPNSCLAGNKVLVRAPDGKTAEREVTVGNTDGKMTQIERGLTAGEVVVER